MLFKKDHGILLVLETGMDLTGGEEALILYKKPSGSSGFLRASVNGTQVECEVPADFLDEVGHWEFQARVEGPGFRLTGAPAKCYVSETLFEEANP